MRAKSGADLGFLKRGVEDSQLTTSIITSAILMCRVCVCVCACERARHKCSLAS